MSDFLEELDKWMKGLAWIGAGIVVGILIPVLLYNAIFHWDTFVDNLIVAYIELWGLAVLLLPVWVIWLVMKNNGSEGNNPRAEPREAIPLEDQYMELFRALGIQARPAGSSQVMSYGGQSIQLYFVRNPDVGIYFSARLSDQHLYPSSLWHHLSPSSVNMKDRPSSGRFPVRPRAGQEVEAFSRLLNLGRRELAYNDFKDDEHRYRRPDGTMKSFKDFQAEGERNKIGKETIAKRGVSGSDHVKGAIMAEAQETVLARFRRAFPASEGWDRQEGIGETGPFGPCEKWWYRPQTHQATVYFRDEERGNVARIAGQASRFPSALREYLRDNVPRDEDGRDYRITAEHADAVIEILRNG